MNSYIVLYSPSNELIIFVSTDCSFVKITSYCLNPNVVLTFVLMLFYNP